MSLYQLPPQNHLYSDPSEDQIENIIRKGGFLVPDPPSYDPTAQLSPQWNAMEQEWVVVDKPTEQLNAELVARIQSETDELYVSLPTEVQATFAPVYIGVKDQLTLGRIEVAKLMVQSTAVPTSLEGVKIQILNSFPD